MKTTSLSMTSNRLVQSARGRLGALAGVAVLMAALSACGGGSDAAATTTQPPIVTAAPLTPAATTPTTPAPGTPVSYVTQGATVMVANASRVNGAAGRMSDQLKARGYQMGAPSNASSEFQRIDVTKIFFGAENPQAQAVAESLKAAFGGGPIEVLPLGTPAPTESGNLPAGVSVVVVMGNDIADKSLDQLQGISGTTTTAAAGNQTGTTAAPTASSGPATTAGA